MHENMRAGGEGIYVRVGYNADVVGTQPHSVKLQADRIESFKSGVQANLSIVGSKRISLNAKVLNKISETLFLTLHGLAEIFLRGKICKIVQRLLIHLAWKEALGKCFCPMPTALRSTWPREKTYGQCQSCPG